MRTKCNCLGFAATIVFGAVLVWPIQASSQSRSFPPPDAQALWKYITQTSPYNALGDGKWHFLPGWEGRKPGRSPHGASLVTYINDIGYKAALKHRTTLPEHTLVVKENYAPAVKGNKQSAFWPNAKLVAITVMYKVKGYNSDANDWYWVKYRVDGSLDERNGMKLAGKLKPCIGCHAMAGGEANDYLIAYDLKNGRPAEQ